MKLLIFTQKVNRSDPILGFFHNWIEKIASSVEQVNVICLEKGEYDLPSNVQVFSLGKEDGKSKLKYIWRFYKYILSLDYDSVFVHMNQEYVLLGSLFWKLKNKKISMWYNHTSGTFLTKLAMFLCHFVFHTSPYAFTANSKRSIRMSAGIDTSLFTSNSTEKINNSILYLGRLDRIKKVHLLIEALKILKNRNIDFVLDMYGRSSPGSESYEEELKSMVRDYELENLITFKNSVSNFETPDIFSRHTIFVNMTAKGNYDKTVLESMACQSTAVVSSSAFAEAIDPRFIFEEDNAEDFADKLEYALKLSDDEKNSVGLSNRSYVIENESLEILVSKLISILE
ncbi:glycosyltransferase [Candidatus Nomurabacteria bacterium]|nr:glycosyltransferase [Candidatus Nomurabacteria bacterium]